jgi:hypothetical protein
MRNERDIVSTDLERLLLEAAEMIQALRWTTDEGKAPPPPNSGVAADKVIADLLEYRRRLNFAPCTPRNGLH